MRHRTILETPQYLYMTFFGKVCCLLSIGCLSKSFRIGTLCYTCCLIRRSPSTAFGFKTSFKVKLECRTKIFPGFVEVNGFRLWCIEPLSLKLLISRFVEFFMPFGSEKSIVSTDTDVFEQVELINLVSSGYLVATDMVVGYKFRHGLDLTSVVD